MLKSSLLVVFLLPCLSYGQASPGAGENAVALPEKTVTEKVIELERKTPQVMEHLEYLVDHIGPRLTGSTNLTRACQWAEAQFAELGLDAHLEQWGEFPVGFDRGPASGGMVAPVQLPFVFGTSAWSPGTPGPVRAQAVLYPKSLDDLEAQRDQLRGAWVVALDRKERPKAKERRKIEARLAELDIAGQVVSTGSELVITFGNQKVEWDELPQDVRIRVAKSYFEDLSARLHRGEEVELEFDVDNRFFPGPVPLYNVIADLKGSELPDEYVIVGGHIDSWDGAEGAQDNGTGVSTTLEAARLLVESGASPRRTIRFMLWSGEEQGLLGSRAYCEAHPELMDKISAVLVHDGGTNYLSGIAGPKALVGQLREAMEPLVDLDSAMPFTVTENKGLSRGGASDHSSFTAKGAPGFFWNQTGRTDYNYIHHTQHDHMEFAVPEYQQHSSIVVALGALGIANLDQKLDRTELLRPGRGASTRRIMGVQLEENEITTIFEDSMAEKAGWQEGDIILSINGVDVGSQQEVVRELQKGGPKKTIKLQRGDEILDSVLDYTGTPSEKARAARAAAKEKQDEKKQEAK